MTANTELSILSNLEEQSKTKCLILDLRDTKHGPVPQKLLEKLALFPLPMGTYREVDWTAKRSDTNPAILDRERRMREVPSQMIEPADEPFRGKIVALVSAETAGPAEQFLEPLVFADRAVLIGDTTAGAAGQVIEVPFGGGAKLAVTVREPVWEDNRGAGRGFVPRVYSVPSAKSLAAGKDDVLERALEFIREQAN